jgi:chemotaxis protein CheX
VLVTTEDMNHIVGEVWDAVFGLAISPTTPLLFDGPVITATVRLHGEHDASLVVRCGNDLAEQMASRIFNLEPGALEPDDLRDTVGEVANIVAGNVKSMLGGECSLSVPTVTEGARHRG